MLTLVVVFGGDSKNCMLNVLILIYLSLVEAFVEVRRVVVLVCYSNPDEFSYCKFKKTILYQILQSNSSDNLHLAI